MEPLEREIVKILLTEPRNLKGQRAWVDAQNLAELQQKHYERLLRAISDISFGDDRQRGSVTYDVDAALEFVKERFATSPPALSSDPNAPEILAPLPVLDDLAVEQLRSKLSDSKSPAFRNPDDALAFGDFAVGGLIYEALKRPKTSVSASIQQRVLNERVRVGMVHYAQARQWYRIQKDEEISLSTAQSRLRLEVDATAQSMQEAKQAFHDMQVELSADLAKVKTSVEGTAAGADELDLRLKEASSTAETRLADLEKSIREELKLQTITTLWDGRATQAKRSLWISAGVLIILAFAGLLTVVCFGQAILNFVTPLNLKTLVMNASTGGAIGLQLGRVLLVSVPIVIYFWMMKVVVRFLIRSMLLMDDARQRHTIMESYFLLTKEGKTDERALPMMLWALFRQVPGHGPDGIEPPDFTEVINAGLKSSLASKPG